MATLTDILIRVPATATMSSSIGISFVRVKAQVMTIFGEAIRVLNRAYSVPHWPLKGKSSSPSFLHDEQLQRAVGELSWLVEATVDGQSHSMCFHVHCHTVMEPTYDAGEESASEFSQLWEKAKMRYLADSGLDVSLLSSVERGDSLAALETALQSGRYSFMQEHKKAHEIERLLIPVIRFVKPFVKPAGKLLEPVCERLPRM